MPVHKFDRVIKSYEFLCNKESKKESFTIEEIEKITGWATKTVTTYVTKKWDKFLVKNGDKYFVDGALKFSEEEYLRMMSQKDSLSNDPLKPDLPLEVERLVEKSTEAAFLALDIYNRPATKFKSEGFTVMMVIAWTSLFHAIFEKRGTDYFYKNDDGTPKLIDGDEKAWELGKCISEFYGTNNNPVKANLEFFIGLRNKIEHRYVPTIDPHVAGECQALLLNYDELLVDHFGSYYALREYLTVPLQTVNLRSDAQFLVMKKFQGKQYDELKDYIDTFRDQLPASIYQDIKYSFRVFLVPKTGNHASSSDISVDFIKYDSEKPQEMEKLARHITLIKERHIQVANQGKYIPSAVAKLVTGKINRPFNVHNHTQAWKYYQVRQSGKTPEGCKTEFCQFDEVHKDYVFTEQWVDFLVRKLADINEYTNVTSFKER